MAGQQSCILGGAKLSRLSIVARPSAKQSCVAKKMLGRVALTGGWHHKRIQQGSVAPRLCLCHLSGCLREVACDPRVLQ